ncbi:septum formation protein [Acinetobacter albensis]|uniref:Septum formation protein n=1 Tax=Acinetobacter albensis TaxID=1673609 RepID=A0A1C4GUI5_9GAMM|nr:septum formation protein [Acinetobacter albensis]
MAHLILASSSPRRRELLQQLGLQFDVFSPEVDESVLIGEGIAGYVQRLACIKADAISAQFPDAVVIAADTSVGVEGNFRKTRIETTCF